MKKEAWAQLVEKLTEEVEKLGYELIDAEFVKEHGEYYLRLYIDRESGIHVDDCEAVSTHIDPLLDEWDPIEQSYYLEVSSPDLSRPLKTEKALARAVGKEVEISFYRKQDGQKRRIGVLCSFTPESFIVEMNGEEREIAREHISKICYALQVGRKS